MSVIHNLAIISALAVAIFTSAPLAIAAEAPKIDPELKKLLAEEKSYRKACKIEICSVLRNPVPGGKDIACHVVKTMPKSDMNKIMAKGKISWPWGHVYCKMDLKLARQTLVDAMVKGTYEAKLGPHQVHCDIDRDKDGQKFTFKLTLTPIITFKNGKAVEADLNWGDLEAPTLAKGVIWPATALDNKLGVFSSEVVDAVNFFADKKCDEVKDELIGQ